MADARADAALEDFRGKDCAFVANWLQEREQKAQQGFQAENEFIPLAKRSCLSKEEGQICIGHLFKKKLTRAKAGQKTGEKRAKKKQR